MEIASFPGGCWKKNRLMNRFIESLGARRYKTYRLYEGTHDYA